MHLLRSPRAALYLVLTACTPEPPPPTVPAPADDTDTDLTDDTDEPGDSGGGAGDSGDTSDTGAPSVYGRELLTDGGFEDGSFGAWLPSGCQIVESASGGLLPADGAWMLYGGLGDCSARQRVDLLAAGADAGEIDAGRVAAVASGWVAARLEAAAYDDQVRLRLVYRDASTAKLSTLESLLGADGTWALRELYGALPPDTRYIDVEVEGRFRQGVENESRADAISLTLASLDPTPGQITLQPMLQDHRSDAMRIVWQTDRASAPARVAWGPVGGDLDEEATLAETVQIDPATYLHRVTVGGLSAAERAEYIACLGEVCTAPAVLQAAPAPEAPVRIGWAADSQDNLFDYFQIHLSHLQARSPDLLVMAGDVVQNGEDLSEWAEDWWIPLTEGGLGQSTPVLIARGNHDKEHPYAYAYASAPEETAWLSFRYGPVFFVILDSNTLADSPDVRLSQAWFLADALGSSAARSAAFRVVVFHEAPFNSVVTTTDPERSSWGWEDGREAWVPLFEEGGVDLVVAGHYHSYQRGAAEGVSYVVIGGGGASLLPGAPESGPYAEMFDVSTLAWHYAVMDVDTERLVWETYDLDDELIDSFTLAAAAAR